MAKELIIPELGENITEVVIAKLLVAVGDVVTEETPVLEVEASKAVLEVPAGESGVIEQLLVSEGAEATVGQAFAVIAVGATATTDAAPAAAATSDVTEAPEPLPSDLDEREPPVPAVTEAPPPAAAISKVTHVPAAPSVRRLARELGIDVDTVRGSAPHGRVTKDDVKTHVRELKSNQRTTRAAASPLPDFAKFGSIHRERMSSIRFATAQAVSASWENVPRVTHFDEVDITQLDALRKRYADRAASQGGKLTMAVMTVKIVAQALKKFPVFNASVDMQSQEIIYKDYVNVGIAVATERGLVVPSVKDADRKNMVDIAVEIGQIATACREGKVTIDMLSGATFTVTNLGAIGGTFFTPIVNYPEVAILGMGRATERVVLEDGKPVSRTMLPLSLSYDHRIIDGADAAHFVRWIRECIEEPLVLSLEGVA